MRETFIHDRCFIDDVEYDQTVIQLRAVTSIWQSQSGLMVPGYLSAEANLQTANPDLIAKLFNDCFSAQRVGVRIVGRIKAEGSDAMIISDGCYASDTELARFELKFGGPIRFTAPSLAGWLPDDP